MRSFIPSTSLFIKSETGPEITEASSLWGGFHPRRAAPFIKVSARKPLSKSASNVYSRDIFYPLSLTRWGTWANSGGSISRSLLIMIWSLEFCMASSSLMECDIFKSWSSTVSARARPGLPSFLIITIDGIPAVVPLTSPYTISFHAPWSLLLATILTVNPSPSATLYILSFVLIA